MTILHFSRSDVKVTLCRLASDPQISNEMLDRLLKCVCVCVCLSSVSC